MIDVFAECQRGRRDIYTRVSEGILCVALWCKDHIPIGQR